MYFSPRKDKDIINELKGLESGDYNYFIKNLIRDGIKYRKGDYNNTVEAGADKMKQPNLQKSPTPASTMNITDLLNVDVVRKEISDKDIEDEFDNL